MDKARLRELYPNLTDQELAIAALNLASFAVLIAEMCADQSVALDVAVFDSGADASYDQRKVESPNN